MSTWDFEDSVAVISGGAGGLGGAIAAALAGRGARVAVLDRAAAGDGLVGMPCDVTDDADVGRAIESVTARLGAPDLVVCAAGVVSEHPLQELSPSEWARVVGVSLTGTFNVVRRCAPALADRGRGAILAFSSGWATKGYPQGGHYAAAKAGVEAFIKSVALELAPRGVRANALAPGPIRTAMLADDFDEAARAAQIPMGRIGTPDDIVGPALFLLGDDSRYVTGQVLHVNGGLPLP